MAPDWIIRLGADAELELPGLGPMPGWRGVLGIFVRRDTPALFWAPVRLRPAGLVLRVPGSETAKWAFGVGRYEVSLHGPQEQLSIPYVGRVLIDRR